MQLKPIKLCAAALTTFALTGCSEVAGPEPALPGSDVSDAPGALSSVALSPQVLYDDFADDILDPDLWTAMVENGVVTVQEVNQRLEITFPATTTGATATNGVMSRCTLLGSFDIQVDYELLTWPPVNGVRLALGAAARDVVSRHSSGASDFTTGETYHTNFRRVVSGLTLTTHTSGKLRLTRSGATLTGYYWSGTDWVLLSSGSITLDVPEIPISLHAWTHNSTFGGEEVKLAFDDVIVSEGTLSCPEPEITQVMVDIKPGNAENAINVRSRGNVRVAVLSTSTAAGDILDFDATTIDVGTVAFGPGGAPPIQSRADAEDVDADGDLDLVFRFDLLVADLPDDATEACVTGDAAARGFAGCDSVKLTGQTPPGRGRP